MEGAKNCQSFCPLCSFLNWGIQLRTGGKMSQTYACLIMSQEANVTFSSVSLALQHNFMSVDVEWDQINYTEYSGWFDSYAPEGLHLHVENNTVGDVPHMHTHGWEEKGDSVGIGGRRRRSEQMHIAVGRVGDAIRSTSKAEKGNSSLSNSRTICQIFFFFHPSDEAEKEGRGPLHLVLAAGGEFIRNSLYLRQARRWRKKTFCRNWSRSPGVVNSPHNEFKAQHKN